MGYHGSVQDSLCFALSSSELYHSWHLLTQLATISNCAFTRINHALGALLGSKIGPEFVRHGTQVARVEGQFDLTTMHETPLSALREILMEGGLTDSEDASDESLIISREINASGRTVARVNGRL